MTAVILALGALLVAAIEVVVFVALVLILTAAAYGVVLGCRGNRRHDPRPRLGAVGVPRQLGERRHGMARQSTQGTMLGLAAEAIAFDGHAIGERLDHDVPGCDR